MQNYRKVKVITEIEYKTDVNELWFECFLSLSGLQPYPKMALELTQWDKFHDAVLKIQLIKNLSNREQAYEEVERLYKHLFGSRKYQSYESYLESSRTLTKRNKKLQKT